MSPRETPSDTALELIIDAEAVRRWSGGVVRSVHIDDRAKRAWPVEVAFRLDQEGQLTSVRWLESGKGEPTFAEMSVVPTALLYLLRDALRVVGWPGWQPRGTSIPDRHRAPYGVASAEESRRTLDGYIRVTADRKALLSSESSRVRSNALRLIGHQGSSR